MSHQISGDAMHFWKIYELIGSTNQIANSHIFPRVCRFCQKDENFTQFKMVAHAFPELLGANDFVIKDECDRCNSAFSAYESHLSKFFLPYLSAAQVKGKNHIPAFHSRTEQSQEITRTIMRPRDNGRLQLILGKNDDLTIDHENKKISIRFRLPPHKPLYVYKALVKIGLSILPFEYVPRYRSVFEWIIGKDSDDAYFPSVHITNIANRKFAEPFAELYQAKQVFDENGFHPELTMIVNFGNLVAQIFLPLSAEFEYERSFQQSPQYEIYPASVMYNFDRNAYKNAKPTDLVTIDFKFTSVDLSSDESVNRDETIKFSFDGLERKIDSTN